MLLSLLSILGAITSHNTQPTDDLTLHSTTNYKIIQHRLFKNRLKKNLQTEKVRSENSTRHIFPTQNEQYMERYWPRQVVALLVELCLRPCHLLFSGVMLPWKVLGATSRVGRALDLSSGTGQGSCRCCIGKVAVV
jgi:hypothetical protein